ncbi:MAG: efflux RND transporter periplasmic adaptor subunit [Alphaproteobacteria bacterium]|nr:efflux RND transporter periplasmic adaptor subunit [Alphaproteobacteria bacterium]
MIKRMILMILVVAVVIGGMIGFKFMVAQGTKKFLSTQAAPAQTVSTITAAEQAWQPEIDAVGSLRAINGADLSSEVPGIVDQLSFDSGGDVEKNAVLAHLRDDDEVAQLKALQATDNLAQVTLDRDLKQIKAGAVSQATVDNDTAALNNAKAQVAAEQAIIDKKTIRAPFAGHLGIRQADIGQFLNAGAVIVTLQQLDPIYVDFNLPEQNLPQVAKGQKIAAKADAVPETSFDGEISAIGAKIDEATRNISVRATIKNPDHKLLPGMFAHVVVTTGAPQQQITLPQTAITYNPYGDTVFIVSKDENGKPTAVQKLVTLGATRGDQVAVLSGIAAGDEVVTSGQLKLRNGTPLKINNEIQPKNDENPKPEDK